MPIFDASRIPLDMSAYLRLTVRTFDLAFWGVVIFSVVMWFATLADHFLRLGWGFDEQGIWIAPLIAGWALLVRKLGRVIFRWVGAIE